MKAKIMRDNYRFPETTRGQKKSSPQGEAFSEHNSVHGSNEHRILHPKIQTKQKKLA